MSFPARKTLPSPRSPPPTTRSGCQRASSSTASSPACAGRCGSHKDSLKAQRGPDEMSAVAGVLSPDGKDGSDNSEIALLRSSDRRDVGLELLILAPDLAFRNVAQR